MTSSMDTAREDLAFMRALIQAGDDGQKAFGEAYFAAGLCYGAQLLLSAAQLLGWISGAPLITTAIGLSGTLAFAPAMVWILLRNPTRYGGVISRAVGAVFGAAGLTNLALIAVIGSVAYRERSVETWLIYPCTVMVLQGLAWLVAYSLRRTIWLLVVAIGWFVTGLAMAATITFMGGYLLAASLGMFAFMLVPGVVIMRQARREA